MKKTSKMIWLAALALTAAAGLVACGGSGEDGGAIFWGHPIGNAVELDSTDSVPEDNHVAVYDKTVHGDFFEYKFNLTATQQTSTTSNSQSSLLNL